MANITYNIYRRYSKTEKPIPVATGLVNPTYEIPNIDYDRDVYLSVGRVTNKLEVYGEEYKYFIPFETPTIEASYADGVITVSWGDNPIYVDDLYLYTSNEVITEDALPPPTVLGKGVTTVTVNEVLAADEMAYIRLGSVRNNKIKLSNEVIISKPIPTGFWALGVACWGTITLPHLNNELITETTWSNNFGYTKDIISYVRAYNATGNIIAGPAPTKTIDAAIMLGKRFELVVSAGTYLSNYGRVFLEFIDASDNVIAALKVDKGESNFGSTLQIGDTLATVVSLDSIGSHPTANGYLDITPEGITYTPVNPDATTKYNSYTFTKDMSNLSKLRISQLGAHQTHFSDATGAPTGSSAYVYLKLL